jgi:LysM domain
VSLNAHLTAGTAEHGRLGFHPDCPRCRAQRLAGDLRDESVVSRRTQAGLAAGLLAFSTLAAPASAQVPEAGQEQEVPVGGGEPPGLQPDLDPGGADTFDYETAPVPGGPQAGGEEDEGQGPPVDTDPTFDPEAPVPPEEPAPPTGPPAESAPAPAPMAPEPAPAPAPAPAPMSPPAPATPAPPPGSPPAQRPAADVERQAPAAEPRHAPRERRALERRNEMPEAERQPLIGTAPAPPAVSAAPVVQPAAAPSPPAPAEASEPAPPATAPVSQLGESPADPIRGRSYTVRPGDSLWSIARRLLGPGATAGEIAREVNRLWELNRDRIGTGDRNLLRVGTVIEL